MCALYPEQPFLGSVRCLEGASLFVSVSQIGLALQNYHDVYQCLPFGKGNNYMNSVMDAPVYARWSAHSQFLPQIEQNVIFNSINFSLPPEVPNLAMGTMPAFQNANLANLTACRSTFSAFYCPSEAGGGSGLAGGNNYFSNEGSWLCDACEDTPSMMAPGEFPRGPFYNRSFVRLASMTDGTSQTAFFSEKQRGAGTPNPKSDLFMIDNASSLFRSALPRIRLRGMSGAG